VRRALARASRTLAKPACQRIFREFTDGAGRPLQETLDAKAESGQADAKLTRDEILAGGLVPPDVYTAMEDATRRLFARGQAIAAMRGLILVDTKYEFGVHEAGTIYLADESHTPVFEVASILGVPSAAQSALREHLGRDPREDLALLDELEMPIKALNETF